MLPVAIKFLIRLTAVSTICFGSFSSGSAKAETLTDTAQKSIVYIFFDIVDPNTGAKSAIQGTGFVVSPQGHVLTASHLFRAWKAQRPVDKANNPIKATLRDKVGYVPESPLILNRINIGDPEQEDVALLKLPASSQAYPAAPICLRQAAAAKAGDPLMAFGFPQNQNFQPVTGVLGLQNAEGGRWAAASAFAEGMSGGPVYIGETVVGLVKGGLEGTNAVQWITPIGFAATLLNNAGVQESCARNLLSITAEKWVGGKFIPDPVVPKQMLADNEEALRPIAVGLVDIIVNHFGSAQIPPTLFAVLHLNDDGTPGVSFELSNGKLTSVNDKNIIFTKFKDLDTIDSVFQAFDQKSRELVRQNRLDPFNLLDNDQLPFTTRYRRVGAYGVNIGINGYDYTWTICEYRNDGRFFCDNSQGEKEELGPNSNLRFKMIPKGRELTIPMCSKNNKREIDELVELLVRLIRDELSERGLSINIVDGKEYCKDEIDYTRAKVVAGYDAIYHRFIVR